MDNIMEVWEKERYVVFQVKRVREGGYVGIRIESSRECGYVYHGGDSRREREDWFPVKSGEVKRVCGCARKIMEEGM